MEIWKEVKGYKDYQVSNLGRVKSLKFNNKRILKAGVNGNGYFVVVLMVKGRRSTKAVHQLVATSFLNHEPNGYKSVVDHINNIPTDNRPENLQIVTQRFNSCKAYKGYKSRYKGVSQIKGQKKWISQIRINGKLKYLGSFTDEKEASEAYQKEVLTI